MNYEDFELTKEDIDHMKERGEYYGYPACCVEWFTTELPDSEDSPFEIHKGTGFIPCPSCRSKVESGVLLGSLISGRKHPLAFPRDDFYTDETVNTNIGETDYGNGVYTYDMDKLNSSCERDKIKNAADQAASNA